jgi:hypothetical protein
VARERTDALADDLRHTRVPGHPVAPDWPMLPL